LIYEGLLVSEFVAGRRIVRVHGQPVIYRLGGSGDLYDYFRKANTLEMVNLSAELDDQWPSHSHELAYEFLTLSGLFGYVTPVGPLLTCEVCSHGYSQAREANDYLHEIAPSL
jgi:hypothetical protein